jgi:hypothetical protein
MAYVMTYRKHVGLQGSAHPHITDKRFIEFLFTFIPRKKSFHKTKFKRLGWGIKNHLHAGIVGSKEGRERIPVLSCAGT